MGTYFNTWERKLGCVTLAAALVLAGIWSQGNNFIVAIEFSQGDRAHYVVLSNTGYSWFARDCDENRIRRHFFVGIRYPRPFKTVETEVAYWKARFHHKKWTEDLLQEKRKPWTVSHGAIVLPLTQISACLLLWKRRTVRPISAAKLVPQPAFE